MSMVNFLTVAIEELKTLASILKELEATKAEKAEELEKFAGYENTLPYYLLGPNELTDISATEFIQATTEYANFLEKRSVELMSKFPKGFKHHSIHVISNTLNIPSAIGMTMEQFGRIFAFVYDDLQMLYPRSPMVLNEGETHDHCCENRFKLFICFYRLKNGCSFRHMETIFGWSHSVLKEWFSPILTLLCIKLHPFHEGILQLSGIREWLHAQADLWRHKVEREGNIEDFCRRIYDHNAKKTLLPPVADSSKDKLNIGKYYGSIGAVDGTFTVRPRVSSSAYASSGQDPSKDGMYSDYIKAHAYKLSVVTSHSIGNYKQLLLSVTIHSASTSDSGAYSFVQLPSLENILIDGGYFLLGDQAYQDDAYVMPPYATTTINAANIADQTFMRIFNGNHSSHRTTAEHGIGFLKHWGICRGRADIDLYCHFELFEKSVKVCWALHNFFVFYSPSTQ